MRASRYKESCRFLAVSRTRVSMDREGATMDMRIIRLPSGGLVEKLGRGVRLTTPCAGALSSDSRTRLSWQMLTVQQAEQALGFRLQVVEWTLTAVGARTVAYPDTEEVFESDAALGV
jgi:hypothetical protein